MATTDYLTRYADLAVSRGGELLSTKYIGCRSKLRWRCSLGHEWEALPLNVKNGTWCPTCGWKGSGEKRRGNNLRRGREVAEAAGGRCLETEEGTATTNALWECSEGHQWRATYSNVTLHKTWCPRCSAKKNGERCIADNLSPARRIAADRGGQCLATENFSIHASVEWECSQGHRWSAVYYSVRRGRWCAVCSYVASGVARRADNLGRAREIARARGGECLAMENFTTEDKVPWRCDNGHEWVAKMSNVDGGGTWCPRCRNKSEEMCHQAVAALFPQHVFRRNVRDLAWLGTGKGGLPLELDIWSEELSLAIEFNGFLHAGPVDAYGGDAHYEKIRQHDNDKATACMMRGVNLLVVQFSEVSLNQRQSDLGLIAEKVWSFVADARYPEGAHLATFEDLLAALDTE